MKNNGLRRLTALLLTCACIGVCFGGTLWLLNHYLLIGTHLYPIQAGTLDLRERDVTIQEYTSISRQLPDKKILWNVPLSDGAVPNTAKEVTAVHLSSEDVQALKLMPELKAVHAEQCRDYPQLLALESALPGCKVSYRVHIGEDSFPLDAESITVPDLDAENVQLLEMLPRLSGVDATGCTDFELLARLQQEKPQWNVTYFISMGRDLFSADSTEAEAGGASYEEVRSGLPGLPDLKALTLVDPKASLDELLQLKKDFPSVTIHWQMSVFDRVITDDTTELDLTGIPITDLAEAEKAADLCPELEILNLSDCGLDNDTLAAFRERKRGNYKVVWTIHFTPKCSARTDDTWFMPTKLHEYYFNEEYVHDLMYCEDMETIDLGHHKIKTIDFVKYMPHLKFLILTETEVKDISPLANCKELVYLELTQGVVMDYAPLVECTALEDLNISITINRPSLDPIRKMTWLKNLWIEGWNNINLAAMREEMPDTNISMSSVGPNGLGWRKLPNYYQQRKNLGMSPMP